MKGVSCLTIMSWMSLLCCIITFMLRVNMAISLVIMPDMTSIKTSTNDTLDGHSTNGTCFENSTMCSNNTSQITGSYNTYTPWQQNVILGIFFWGIILTEFPGGRLTEIIGPRKVIGYSILLASILTLITPFISIYIGYYGLLVIRFLAGLTLGAIMPSLHPIAARWVPPTDRGKFMSNILGVSLGAAITYPMCGLIISWLGWHSVFYITGSIALLWTIGWFILAYDSPDQHPRISEEEKLKLNSLITSIEVLPVPWKRLLTSGPVWAIIITQAFSFMNYSTLTLQIPSFVNQIFKLDIKNIGFFSSIPHIGKYGMGLSAGYIASYILQNNKLSVKNTRRTFLFISMGMPAILMLLQAYTGTIMIVSIILFTLTLSLTGTSSGGHFCGALDIAPNFAGTIFGIANMLGSLGSLLSGYFVGFLTSQEQTFVQWQIIFWTLSGTYLASLISYLTLGSTSLQDWNTPKKIKKQSDSSISETDRSVFTITKTRNISHSNDSKE